MESKYELKTENAVYSIRKDVSSADLKRPDNGPVDSQGSWYVSMNDPRGYNVHLEMPGNIGVGEVVENVVLIDANLPW